MQPKNVNYLVYDAEWREEGRCALHLLYNQLLFPASFFSSHLLFSLASRFQNHSHFLILPGIFFLSLSLTFLLEFLSLPFLFFSSRFSLNVWKHSLFLSSFPLHHSILWIPILIREALSASPFSFSKLSPTYTFWKKFLSFFFQNTLNTSWKKFSLWKNCMHMCC